MPVKLTYTKEPYFPCEAEVSFIDPSGIEPPQRMAQCRNAAKYEALPLDPSGTSTYHLCWKHLLDYIQQESPMPIRVSVIGASADGI